MSIEGLPEAGEVFARNKQEVTEAEIQLCALLTNESGRSTFGICCVLALRSICDWGQLPDAAIMRGYRAKWHQLPSAGAYVTEARIVSRQQPRERYVAVTLGYVTYRDADVLVAEQEQDILWPISQ